MKRFTAVLNDGGYVSIPATRMMIQETAILVWNGDEFVAYIDTAVILSAYISERKESNG